MVILLGVGRFVATRGGGTPGADMELGHSKDPSCVREGEGGVTKLTIYEPVTPEG